MNTTAKLTAFPSPHGTLNVMVHNCSSEVNSFLWRFDVWGCNGHFKYTGNPKERPEIWFECPMKFLDFLQSEMGKRAFKRMGVEEFDISFTPQKGKCKHKTENGYCGKGASSPGYCKMPCSHYER